jgi:hypothetical protein
MEGKKKKKSSNRTRTVLSACDASHTVAVSAERKAKVPPDDEKEVVGLTLAASLAWSKMRVESMLWKTDCTLLTIL